MASDRKEFRPVRRVMVFVDGFNLYFGLKHAFGRRFHWLNLQALTTGLLHDDQELVQIKYFTARVRNCAASERRQSDYLDALNAYCDKLEVISGRFQEKHISCRRCGSRWIGYEEKETDVSIATALLEHGVTGDFDEAMIISGDSDLCPAVRALRRLRPEKRVIIAFPPARSSADLARWANASFRIGRSKIRQSQLPESIVSAAGVELKRPSYWH